MANTRRDETGTAAASLAPQKNERMRELLVETSESPNNPFVAYLVH